MLPRAAKRCSRVRRCRSSIGTAYARRRRFALYVMLASVHGRAMPVSATLAANDVIARRRAEGLPVVPLGFGEAGLPVHPLLTAALGEAAGSAGYGPVAGIP